MSLLTYDRHDLNALRHRQVLSTGQLRTRDRRVDGVRPARRRCHPRRTAMGGTCRNGPTRGRRTAHWFTGDGMIHGVRIEGGPRRLVPATAGCGPTASKTTSRSTTPTAPATCAPASPNTHVVTHAGKTLALVESSLPYEISNDLETVGAYDFGGKLVDSMDRASEDLPNDRRAAFLRLRQHLRALCHLSPC